jgi:hypothetical protein
MLNVLRSLRPIAGMCEQTDDSSDCPKNKGLEFVKQVLSAAQGNLTQYNLSHCIIGETPISRLNVIKQLYMSNN